MGALLAFQISLYPFHPTCNYPSSLAHAYCTLSLLWILIMFRVIDSSIILLLYRNLRGWCRGQPMPRNNNFFILQSTTNLTSSQLLQPNQPCHNTNAIVHSPSYFQLPPSQTDHHFLFQNLPVLFIWPPRQSSYSTLKAVLPTWLSSPRPLQSDRHLQSAPSTVT